MFMNLIKRMILKNFNDYQNDKDWNTFFFFFFNLIIWKKIYDKLEKLKYVESTEKNVKWRQLVFDNDSYIFNKLLNDYELEYAKFSDEKNIYNEKA